MTNGVSTTPLVSPVCLNDDAVALHLLVKLGRYQEAATAYAEEKGITPRKCDGSD